MSRNIAIIRRLLTVTFAVAALSATLWGCNKDEDGMLEIFAESFGGDTKLVVNNRIAEWQNGDKVRINGTTAVVTRKVYEQTTHAYIPTSAVSAVNRAVFPDTLCSSIGDDSINITLPAEYSYRTEGGIQVLEVPMAAVSAESSPMHFSHLTGALNVRLVGRDFDLELESLTVSSDKYQLSGECPLDFSDISGQTAQLAANEQQKSVSLTFNGTVLPQGGSLDVIVPIAPVLSDNHFTIKLKARKDGKRYVYTRSQHDGGSLERNVMAYAEVQTSQALGEALFEGSGTESSPYRINTKEDFLLFHSLVENDVTDNHTTLYSRCCFRLTDSIDMTGDTISPITKYGYGATFDGGGFAIKNLTVTSVRYSSTEYNCGLFSMTKSKIKNLIMDNVTLFHSGNVETLNISPLCAKVNVCTISNCTIRNVEAHVSGTIDYLNYGGLVAYTSDTILVSNCIISGLITIPHISGQFYYGGVIGQISNGKLQVLNSNIDNRVLNLRSGGRVYFGGIIGYLYGSTSSISSCTWYGDVNIDAQNTYAGGVVGMTNSLLSFSYTYSAFTGSITATTTGSSSYLGRIAGRKTGSPYTNTGSTSTVVLKLNGNTVDADIGKQ